MPTKPNVLKWTLQSSATEHEQHRIRMNELKSKPAMVHDIQDRELPQIVRSKIVLSGLRSTEQERHWQVELSRHKHSLKEISSPPHQRNSPTKQHTTSSPTASSRQNQETTEEGENTNKNHKQKRHVAAPPPSSHHQNNRNNPYSLKRFKVAAEIETQNERIMTNLKSVRPTVATARQCNQEAETRRRARRHFQRFPTPVGPPTIPGFEQNQQSHHHHTARSAGRSRQLPPLDNQQHHGANTDNRKRRNKNQEDNLIENQNENNNNNVIRPLTYTEQREVRERGWDSTTSVVYAQNSKGRSSHQPLEYMTIPSPLRLPEEEHKRHINNNKNKNESQNQQRQLLASSARGGSGVQPGDKGYYDSSSSSDSDSGYSSSVSTTSGGRRRSPQDDLSVKSRDSSPERKSPKKKPSQNNNAPSLKPQPPSKSTSSKSNNNNTAKKAPQRINFLSALKQNPVLTQRKSQLQKQAREELANMEDVDRRDIEEEEDEHWQHLLQSEYDNNPEVLEQEYYDTITRKREMQKLMQQQQQQENERLQEQQEQQETSSKSKSAASASPSREVHYTTELLHKLDRLNDIEDDERVAILRQEERQYQVWLAEEEELGHNIRLEPHVRTTQNFIHNRPPSSLVRKMVLLRAKHKGRTVVRSMQYRCSRDVVLSQAIDHVRRGLLVSEDEVAAKKRDQRYKVESEESDNRDGNVVADEMMERNEIAKASRISEEEAIRRIVQREAQEKKDRELRQQQEEEERVETIEKKRKSEIARPTSQDAIERAFLTRERNLWLEKDAENKKKQAEQNNQKQKQQDEQDLETARRETLSRPASRDVVASALRTRYEQLSRQNSPVAPSRNSNVRDDDDTNKKDDTVFLTQQQDQEEEEKSVPPPPPPPVSISPPPTSTTIQNEQQQRKEREDSVNSARRERLSRPVSRDAIDSALRKRESQLSQRSNEEGEQQQPEKEQKDKNEKKKNEEETTTPSISLTPSPPPSRGAQQQKVSSREGRNTKPISRGSDKLFSVGDDDDDDEKDFDISPADQEGEEEEEEDLDSARRTRLSRPSSRDIIDSAMRKRESQLSQRSDDNNNSKNETFVTQQQQKPVTASENNKNNNDGEEEEELPEF